MFHKKDSLILEILRMDSLMEIWYTDHVGRPAGRPILSFRASASQRRAKSRLRRLRFARACGRSGVGIPFKFLASRPKNWRRLPRRVRFAPPPRNDIFFRNVLRFRSQYDILKLQ